MPCEPHGKGQYRLWSLGKIRFEERFPFGGQPPDGITFSNSNLFKRQYFPLPWGSLGGYAHHWCRGKNEQRGNSSDWQTGCRAQERFGEIRSAAFGQPSGGKIIIPDISLIASERIPQKTRCIKRTDFTADENSRFPRRLSLATSEISGRSHQS